MKNSKTISFWLILMLSLSVTVFTSCIKDDNNDSSSSSIAVTGISLNQSSLSLAVGATYTLTATITPADASSQSITWASSDATKATVTNGVITGVAVGTVIITAKAGTHVTTCKVTVTVSTPATAISLNNTSLYYLVGETPISAQTLVATITPNNATDNNITWTSSNTSIATVSNTGTLTLTTTTAGTAIVTATVGTKTATCTITVSTLQTSGFVTINGVKWAACNVNTPGTFTTNPEDAGMFYQWNRNIGWPSTGAMGKITATNGATTWDEGWWGGFTTYSVTNTWATASDPSPTGYRVPTSAEIQTLVDNTKVTATWTTQNSVHGEKFTDIASGNSIFFPASGDRYYGNGSDIGGTGSAGELGGTLDGAGRFGNYWSSMLSGIGVWELTFSSSYAVWGSCASEAYGQSVRPVAE